VKETPESVLESLPDWAGASIVELSGGLSNNVWLIEADHGKAVLKIDPHPRHAPFNARRAEAQIQTVAALQGLANRVLYVTDTVYMTEYLEGAVWSRRDLDDDGNLVRLARALRRLHSLPLTGRVFDARQAARQYAVNITDADPVLFSESMRVVDEMPAPHHLCCCHNDLVIGNIIATPEVHFLDWEYACDNDPFFDLAAIVAHHELSGPRVTLLLDEYFEGSGARWRQQLVDYERFYNAILWLWQAARQSRIQERRTL